MKLRAGRVEELAMQACVALAAAAALLAPASADASRYLPGTIDPVTARLASLEELTTGAAQPSFPVLTTADRVNLADLAAGARLEAQRLRLFGGAPEVQYDAADSPTTRSDYWRSAIENRPILAYDDSRGQPSARTRLFQGLWTDPVTGLSYARARWYDARNASWLSEDPLLDVDSPNLYAFVGWGPHVGTDPMGECLFGIGGTCAEWADTAAAGFEWAKREVRANTGGGLLGVGADFLVSTTLDVTETFLVDPLRVGAATGEAVSSDAGALETSLAVVQDVGRAAVVAGGVGNVAKAAGRTLSATSRTQGAVGAAARTVRSSRAFTTRIAGPQGGPPLLARLKGKIGALLTEAERSLHLEQIVGREITFATPKARTAMDYLTRSRFTGKLRAIEAKFGSGATLRRGQGTVARAIKADEAMVRGPKSVQKLRELGFSGGSKRNGMIVSGIEYVEQRFPLLEAMVESPVFSGWFVQGATHGVSEGFADSVPSDGDPE